MMALLGPPTDQIPDYPSIQTGQPTRLPDVILGQGLLETSGDPTGYERIKE
jgi:hypothetical protein